MQQPILPLPSSYRDNDGFVFKQDDVVYRLIKPSYFEHYNLLMQSGLYNSLTTANRLICHTEEIADNFKFGDTQECKIILPQQIPFITQPSEWSFNMWKDASIVTLKVALQALEFNMFLKDATPFNIQFHDGRPVFIDTLSFEKYEEGKPWIAYHQFCECFLAPLLLMHYNHRDMGKIVASFPNGVPLDLLKKLLPFKSKFNLQVYLHVHMQNGINKKETNSNHKNNFSKSKFILLLNGLLSLVNKLQVNKANSVWDNYYEETILNKEYLEAKKILVSKFVDKQKFEKVIDLGANDGVFSLLLKDNSTQIISIDADVNCINELYKNIRKNKIKNILPLFSSLNAPTPAVGWNNEERASLTERLKADLVLALALVHHLAIGNNVPLTFIAKWLHQMAPLLIIEFIPKSDEKVKQLLQNREDIFDDYNLNAFIDIFSNYYNIITSETIGVTDRTLFLMKRK